MPNDSTQQNDGVPRRSRSERLLVGLLLGLAVLAASFPARNSDLWFHLAAGRRLVEQGDWFAEPADHGGMRERWANHFWMTQVLLHSGYATLGGGVLVAGKALLAGLTALVLLRAARRPGFLGLTVVPIALAVVAMVPRWHLRPDALSLFLLALAVCLWQQGRRSQRWLPVVMILWTNLDRWYVLGLGFIIIASIGAWIGNRRHGGERVSWWLVPACLLSSLITPFWPDGRLPAEISLALRGGPDSYDPRFADLFQSPWSWDPLGSVGGYNLTRWAFWVLAGLGVVLCAANRQRFLLGWQGTAWLGFVSLAFWNAALIPFFAVVAGPITARNLVAPTVPEGLRRLGTMLVASLLVVLIMLAIPGWLQGFGRQDLGFAWRVEPSAGLQRAAETIRQWRQDGTLPSDVPVIASHPDVMHYLVWYGLEDALGPDIRLDYGRAWGARSRMVAQVMGLLIEPPPDDWRTMIPSEGVGRYLVYDPDAERLARAVHRLGQSRTWEVEGIAGGVLVVRWAESAGRRFAPRILAFSEAVAEQPRVSGDGVDLMSERGFWERLRQPPRRRGWEGDAAGLFLRLFESRANPDQVARSPSPALPILAIRHARVAVASSITDDEAWRTMGQAYTLLSRTTWETESGRGFPLLVHVRQAQIAAALRQATLANPANLHAHGALAGLYAERGFQDLSVVHRRAQWRLARRHGPRDGESRAEFEARVRELTADLEQAENQVFDAQNRFSIQTYNSSGDPLARARTAVRLGLGGQAIDILTTAHPDLYGPEGLRLLLELLVWTGQAAEARLLLDRAELRERPDSLGEYEIMGGVHDGIPWSYRLHAYDWFDLCQGAAAGRYTKAQGALQRLQRRLKEPLATLQRPAERGFAFLLASQVGLGAGRPIGLLHGLSELGRTVRLLRELDWLVVQQADLHVLAGLLALEQGDVRAAGQYLQSAMAQYRVKSSAGQVRPGYRLAQDYGNAIRVSDH